MHVLKQSAQVISLALLLLSVSEPVNAQRVRGTPKPVLEPVIEPVIEPIYQDPIVLDPVIVDTCRYYEGQSEDFDFRKEPNESVGVCSAAWERTDPSGDGVSEALDLLAASGRFPIQMEWDGVTPAGVLVSPAGTKGCQCVARPYPKEFMAGSPEYFWGSMGATRNCGVRRGTWQFTSCKSTAVIEDPVIGGSCPIFRLAKQTSEGPGGIRTQVFSLTGYSDPSDVFGLTLYGHNVTATGFGEVASHAKWLTEQVAGTSPDQWNSAGMAPYGSIGFPPRIEPSIQAADSASFYLYLDDANQAVPWIRSAKRPECSSGGCPAFVNTVNAVEGERRILVFNLGGMFSPGDAIGFKIYGYDAYVKYEAGMSNLKLADMLAERIRSVPPDEWVSATEQKSLVERVHRYPIEIGAGGEEANPYIKMAIDPAQLAIPILITSKGSCNKIPPFRFDPAGGSLGVIDQGSSASMTVAVFNTSGRTIKGCSIFTSDPENFMVKAGTECEGFPAGGACKFELIGSPSYNAYGSVTGNVYISCGSEFAMSEVAGFRFEVGAMLSAPDLQVKPLTLDFGMVKVGAASTVQQVTVTNSGDQPAQTCKVYLTNTEDFLIKNPEACYNIPGKGGGCTLDLVAIPKTDGAKRTTLNVACSNATGQSTPDGILVNFSTATPTATPVTTPAPVAWLSFTTPSTADFGTVTVGNTGGPLSLTLVNSGTLDASLCKLAFTGPDAGQFQFDSTCSSIPASSCQTVCQKGCPVGDICGYDVKLSCCVNYSNPGAAMECPLCKPGACTFNISGRPTVAGAMKSQISVSCGTGGSTVSSSNGITMNATQPAGTPTPSPTPSCSMEGAIKLPSGDCACPSGYEVGTNAVGAQACRPALPSSEFVKAGDAFSDGYPVCGTGRMPLTTNFFLGDISTNSRPLSSYKFIKLGNTYSFAKDNSADPTVVLPQYLYSAASLKRCVCSSSDIAYDSGTISTSTGKLISGSGRFVSDLFEAVSAASTSNPNPDTYGAVAIAHDGSSNGYLGSMYYPGHGGSGTSKVSCGCPNLNEKASAISSVNGSGYSCSPALDTSDANTRKYMVLASYDPAIHDASASTTHLIDRSAPTAKVTRIQLPAANGGYRTYNRRIWTCAPPSYLDISSKTCKIKESVHMCDNGDTSGVPSAVSQNLSGSTVRDQFNNAANPKLACCLNAFDRKNPANPLKYDCFQNSEPAPDNFEQLWMSTDPPEAGGQGNAIVLTDGSGRPVTGFFTLTGARCSEYSEFAGAIREATVNPVQIASQQNLSGNKFDQNFIQFSGNVIGPPPRAQNWFSSKKAIPDQTANPARAARECPILARAALVVSCGTEDASGQLPQQFTDSKGNVRCLAAKTIKVHMRIQQVYRITGMPSIKTFDTIMDLDEAKRSGVNMEGMIRARAGAFCPAGSSYVEGNCLFK